MISNPMVSTSVLRLAAALAAIMGAFGVVLAAAAAHLGDAARLGPASNMLLFHAPAVIAAVLLTGHGLAQRQLGLTATFAMIAGAAMFSGDLAMRHYTGNALFPLAAPIGGSLLILSWIVLAIAAIWPRRAG
jgi:uncharacterized membrane protein YgdD (TMEM256/DUF423 family)